MSGALLSMGIAEPYAQALMSVAQSHDLTEQFGESFRELEILLDQSQEFRDFVMNPVIKSEAKKSVITQVMGNDANPYLLNFLMLLVDKRRIVFFGRNCCSISQIAAEIESNCFGRSYSN